ncbi:MULTISPECIES: GGDEF domain-containing protein [Pontibacillus]|uniref:Sensor domain-containing diguanylate cyclase n=1 Tax=Pontibacillus chungwhensis TaxID=265426 RepID=A0ABY8UZP9_9BACI|nr:MULTISPECIES: sensor domain-containing diguanylate cyclase [Pontibacillus]MCD5324533.1 sensor domain-containing diguanylate cyclase [Pontibacillus sp. HN14]WIF99171.1 sensor domain-containing diguanylate cyclase [Pontibacillus chungwhensis]
MEKLYFVAGLAVGLFLFSVYTSYVKHRWKEKNDKEKQIYQLVENSRDIIYIVQFQPEQKHIYISPALDAYLGKGIVEASLEDPFFPFKLIHPDDVDILERKITDQIDYSKPFVQRWRNRRGEYRWFEEYASPVYNEDGDLVELHGILRNIDEKVQLQQNLEYRSTHDALTGLFNRDYFDRLMEKYDHEVESSVGMILCDLDKLKDMNDRYGHKKGDAYIQKAADLFVESTPENAVVSRVGGDEFTILLTETTQEEVGTIFNRIEEKITTHNNQHRNARLHVSMGYAFRGHSPGHMEELFIEADQRMYQHKRSKPQVYSHT